MYTSTIERVFNVYCHKDYEYFLMIAGKKKCIKKGEIVTILYTKYETNNIDKAVSYSYIIKNDNHHINAHDFSDFFITKNKRRKALLKNMMI